MMAKREKDKLYYEITREKPFGDFQTLMVGGAAGSVVAFLITSLVGACAGLDMDLIVLSFLISSFLGFFLGAVFTWLTIRYFSRWVTDASVTGVKTELTPNEESLSLNPDLEAALPDESDVVSVDDESKGKSVDFVFPELSPDKQ